MSKILSLIVGAVFIAGCASSPKVETNVKNVEANVNKAEANVSVNQSIASLDNQPNSSAIPDPYDENRIRTFPISKENDFRNPKGKRGASADDKPIAENIKSASVAAPDNSEIVSSMDAQGQPIETRTFKKHPILLKIERVNLNDGDIKLYLKNGKAVVLPEAAAKSFLTASAAELLKAANVK